MFNSSRYSYNESIYGECFAPSMTLNVPLSPAASEVNPFLDVAVKSVESRSCRENGSGVQPSTIPIHIPASKECNPQPHPVIRNIGECWNLVGSADVRFAILLEGLSITHSQFCRYEPELFPGLVYRIMKPRVVLLIFGTGRIVITGAKTRDEINEAFDQIYPILRGFKR